MSLLFEGPDDTGTLMLKGELTIQHGARLKEVLLSALDRTTNLSIALEGITEIDLSCLQVLCSAHRTAICSQKSIVVAGAWSEDCRSVVERSGYARSKSCGSPANVSCLWNQENADE